jgi:hypothetical protein
MFAAVGVLLPYVYKSRLHIRSRGKFVLGVFVHALALTAITLLFCNRSALVFGEETKVIKTIGEMKEGRSHDGYQFVRDNFVLIDNSFDKTIIPNPAGTDGDNTGIVITDRKKLAALFHFANVHPDLIDMIVCDIGFPDTTADDHHLRREMDTALYDDKLLVSGNGTKEENPTFRFPASAVGDAAEQTSERQFITHTLTRGNAYSLPYKIYAWMYGATEADAYLWGRLLTEHRRDGTSAWAVNTFLPLFSMTDERRLESEYPSGPTLLVGEADTTTSAGWELRNLGYLVSPDGAQDLQDNLSQRKTQGKRNILLIGAFKGQDEDIHKTIHGPLHGTTILLNLVFDLQKGEHIVTAWQVFILVVFFMLATLLVFYTIKHGSMVPKPPAKEKDDNKSPLMSAIKEYFFLPIHMFALLIMGIVLIFLTHRTFNASLLILYFLAIEVYWKTLNKKNTKHHDAKAAATGKALDHVRP